MKRNFLKALLAGVAIAPLAFGGAFAASPAPDGAKAKTECGCDKAHHKCHCKKGCKCGCMDKKAKTQGTVKE